MGNTVSENCPKPDTRRARNQETTVHNRTSKTEQSELLTSQRAQTPPHNTMGSSSRRLRAFKRWMRSQGIDFSDALQFTDDGEAISVRALCDLKVGDMVARIPKTTCLTVKTSGARELIESAGLGGSLGLSVAVMYERSLGQSSPWAPYLHLLPPHESLPLLWSLHEVDSLLCGTELHKTVKEDKAIIYEDWKENILPLLDSPLPFNLNPNFFGVEQYLAARSLIASRSFAIDEFHESGMVPLADLFNHKTGAEDVHFTSVSSHPDSKSDTECSKNDLQANTGDNEPSSENSYSDGGGSDTSGGSDLDNSLVLGDHTTALEMIMVKDVKVGNEVFNTYGLVGNAALLHRYGFTEPDNPFDIVNIDLELVSQWSLSLFSGRYSRAKLSLWRRLGYSGCVSENTEYFEISSDGEPQIELLILLYIMLLPEDTYHKLDLTLSTKGNSNGSIGMILSEKGKFMLEKASEVSKDLLLTKDVCNALRLLADMRDSFYGSNSMKDDIEALGNCCIRRERKLYYSLILRISERGILERLRTYAASGVQSFRTAKRSSVRKKLKKT